jgi:hypothetical protein
MEGGYVLDFTNAKFRSFFLEYGVDIDDLRFADEGTSKAKRLRLFLRVSEPALVARVLDGLLQHRLAQRPHPTESTDIQSYRALIARLGPPPVNKVSVADSRKDEVELLRRVYDQALFQALPVEVGVRAALIARMDEAQRCLEARAHLAAVILCGSILEGICLGYGMHHKVRLTAEYGKLYPKRSADMDDWKLFQWIDVLAAQGDLSPNVAQFGHALRDFRNYVHPNKQLESGFSPDQHTARIAFQVVVAAIEDLANKSSR